jgi:hypothetical protein
MVSAPDVLFVGCSVFRIACLYQHSRQWFNKSWVRYLGPANCPYHFRHFRGFPAKWDTTFSFISFAHLHCVIQMQAVKIRECSFLNINIPKSVLIVFKNSVRTSKKTQHVSMTTINWVMLFGEIIAVHSENHTKLIHTLWAKCRLTDCFYYASQIDWWIIVK